MEIEKIKQALRSPDYNFLKETPVLNENVVLLTMGGSIAYGTDHKDSDIDIRGIASLTPHDLYMMNDWKTFNERKTDTVIYSLNHAVNLMTSCNPNTIEMLGSLPEQNIYLSEVGKSLIENRDMFLSQMAIDSFCRYASQQFQKMENQMMNRNNPDRTQINIFRTIKRTYHTLQDQFGNLHESQFNLYLDKASYQEDGLTQEIYVDFNLKHYPLRQLNELCHMMRTIERDYRRTSQRNMKALKHDKINKHCEHLIRLYMTGIDILEKGDIITHREGEDLDVLLAILHKEFMDDKGLPNDEFYKLVESYQKKFEDAVAKTKLPEKPDFDRIEKWLIWANNYQMMERI